MTDAHTTPGPDVEELFVELPGETMVQVSSNLPELLGDLAVYFEGGVQRVASCDVFAQLHISVVRASGGDGDPVSIVVESPGVYEHGLSPAALDAAAVGREISGWFMGQSTRFYGFHAGAVAREGRGILIPGSTRSGKSSLVAGMLAQGFELLSDEIGLFDVSRRRLTPYPRSLCIREDMLEELGYRQDIGIEVDRGQGRLIGVNEIGATRATSTAQAGIVVFPSCDPNSDHRLEPVSQADAVLALMGCSCSQAVFGERGLDWVIELSKKLTCYRLVFSVLERAVDDLRRLSET